MEGLKVQAKDGAGDSVHLELSGYLDAHNYENLEKTFAQHFAEKRFRFTVDLSHLEYISSAGAGVFIGAASTCQEYGGEIVLLCPTPEVQEIFELLGVSQIFTVVKEREEAVGGI